MLHRTVASQRPSGVAARSARSALRPTPIARVHVARAAATEAKKEEFAAAQDEHDGPEVNPSTQQVATFINTLCNDTEIAEMHLKIGSFELKLKRSVAGGAAAAINAFAHPPVAAAAAVEPAPAQPVEVPTVEDTVDESLVYVNSPKVGIFRRGKYAGGKRAGKGNLVDIGAQLKKGQTIGYVEQLGTFVECKTPIAGELVKMHLEDGSPVEYQQLVAEVAPFFGGHIIGDSKYA